MSATDLGSSSGSPPLAARPPRLLMPLLVVVGYWVGWGVMSTVFAGTFPHFMYLFWSPMVVTGAVGLWILFFSRLAWLDRLWTLAALAVGAGLAIVLCDRSMPFGLLMYALPVALTAVIAWLFIHKGAPTLTMRLGLLAASLTAWGYFTLLRIDGISGNMSAERSWRWEETAEERRLAELSSAPSVPSKSVALEPSDADWTDFRGPARDGVVRGTSFGTDWKADPPRELWRRRIGPGWSSFVVVGDVAFTQEQRGEEEAVICLALGNGEQLWEHKDKARFYEVVAGAGPRATPTFARGKLYVQGASGILNCLDAASGKPIWSRDILQDANPSAKTSEESEPSPPAPPLWGFSSSPLVTGGLVVTFAGGKDGKSVLAYDADTGEPKWTGGKGVHGYSSPQLANLGGAEQVLMVSDHGLESFEPLSGKLLWENEWILQGVFRVCQPHVLPDGRILLGTPMSGGTRMLSVNRDGERWNVSEEWLADDFQPYFNDFVSYDGYIYGFDGEIFTCRDLATGSRQWKKGRYGHGQVLLAADQGMLVILSEKGELVLVQADPQKLVELGKVKALQGKTWNHPVITGNRILVRNAEEMACFELPSVESTAAGR